MFRAQDALWRLVFAEIGDLLVSKAYGLGRFSVVEVAAAIQNLNHFLGGEKAEVFVVQAVCLMTREGIFCSIAARP